jgi:hypothetical protein
MDQDNTANRRRLKVAGIAAAAVLAVPGGMAISNAFAADGGSTPSSPTAVPVQTQGDPQPYGDGAQPPADRGGAPGDRRDCPPGEGGSGSGDGDGAQGSSGSTAYTLQ